MFMLSLMFSSCSDNIMEEHLIQLNKINNQIDRNGWNVVFDSQSEEESFYGLDKQVSDTTISLGFSCARQNEGVYYIIDGFTKTFVKDSLYFELSLHNYDTLYFFSRLNAFKNKSLQHYYIDSLNFIVGKYYYLNQHEKYTSGQKKFFMKHKDSLLKIRGNTLPPLPEEEFDGLITSPLWFLDKRSGVLYDVISGKKVEN
jgi:hypothetical protein